MYTDAFQGSLMFIGMTVLLLFTYTALGGVTAAHQALSDLTPQAVGIFGALGHRGWTSMPEIGSVFWLQLVTTIVLGVGIGVLAQPQLVVRFMTVKSDRELNRAVLIGGVFILMMTGVAFVVGALTNVFFAQHAGFNSVSIVAAGKVVENIIPLYIREALPPWFTVVFMITLLAAAMSTLSSQFHNMGTSIGRDVYEKGFNIRRGNSVYISRAGIAFGILISLIVAWALPRFLEEGSAIVAIGTAIFFGLCAAVFLPMYFGALYSRRITRAGAIACFLSGTIVSLFWLFFVHAKESVPLGLCRLLFGVDSLAGDTKWKLVDPLIVSLPVSAFFTLAVSALTRPPKAGHLDKCFRGIR
jgi:SSS family solute:Na+ symporter